MAKLLRADLARVQLGHLEAPVNEQVAYVLGTPDPARWAVAVLLDARPTGAKHLVVVIERARVAAVLDAHGPLLAPFAAKVREPVPPGGVRVAVLVPGTTVVFTRNVLNTEIALSRGGSA